MVIVKILGGLGNQLFQYSLGQSIEAKTGLKVVYDMEDFKSIYTLRQTSLYKFNTQIAEASKDQIKNSQSFYNILLSKIFKLSKGKLISSGMLKYYAEPKMVFDDNLFSLLHDNLYLNGYWQSEKYFQEIHEKIRKDLEITTIPSVNNIALLKQMTEVNSVSIHVRRGDYILDSSAKKIYAVCPIEYYERAIMYIVKKIENPVFFVFSDDYDWTKSNLKIEYPTTFVNENNGDAAVEDLRLMSACKHNIIANSTFSWWGAWLNKSPQKIVIAPKLWFYDVEDFYSDIDLIPNAWVRL